MRSRDRGFTLLELMIVVALVAVLASIVIPSFFGESNRAKAEAEVASVFAEMRTKQEAFKVEMGTYLSTAADEATLAPAGALTSTERAWGSLPAGLITLKFVPPQSKVYCGYVAIAGPAEGGTIGTIASTQFGMASSPVSNWYYLLARCNLDGDDGTKDTLAFSSSVISDIQWKNVGH